MARPRRRWKTVLFIVGMVLALPAVLPHVHRYDPGPYFEGVKASAAFPLVPGATPPPGDLIIRNARIVDVGGARGPLNIRIESGRITAIAEDVGAGSVEIDAAGATVMPGLIDAHVHLSLTPGGLTRLDPPETTRALRLHHLRAYLASGITTIFDPAVENVVMEDIQRDLASGQPGPRYLGVGTPMATPDGYLESLFPPGIRTPADVAPQLDANLAAGAVGTKMSFERGFAAPVWKLHPPEIERAIVEESARRKLPLYIHAERADMVRRALALHPHALVHCPIDGDPALAREIAQAGVPVITTLSLFFAHKVMLHPEELDAPLMRRTIHPLILQSLRDPAQHRAQVFGLLSESLPFVPGLYRDALSWMMTTESGVKATDEANANFARQAFGTIGHLRAANVPLVMGSDSGNWPLFPYYFHGPTSVRELRLLAEAGLSPMEVLRASTVNAARMLGIENEVGTVEVGRAADLLIVTEDPLQDVEKAVRSLRHTIRAGVARTPDGWMTGQ